MPKSVPITEEIARRFGIICIDPFVQPDLPDKGLPGVCKWFPGVALARIGRTNLTIGLVHALPYDGKPQMAIKERHPQDEVFVVLGELELGLSETMDETADDVVWVVLGPGAYVIRAGVIHVPPVSRTAAVTPMIVLQGTKNTTDPTAAVIAHLAPAAE